MAYDSKGTIRVIGDTQKVSEKFSKRPFVVEIPDGKYPQLVEFQLTGDRCSVLDDFRVGDEVRVTWNLRGREWKKPGGETRYFNSCDVWKLERTSEVRGESRVTDQNSDNPDDLPF